MPFGRSRTRRGQAPGDSGVSSRDAPGSGSTAEVASDGQLLLTDRFCRDAPSPRTMVDIFAGDWSSRLPAPYEELTGAQAQLFDDARIHWGAEQFGGVTGMRVLELGPLEGGHTYLFDRKGAREVVAVEANRLAFLRCLVVKELLGIPSARFLCGDFVEYLKQAERAGTERFDLCSAVGVLYHQQDPVALLELAAKASDRLLLWTHYYDESVVSGRPEIAAAFSGVRAADTAGFAHTLHRHEYGTASLPGSFCGGLEAWSSWMLRDEIVGCLEHLGFEVLGIEFDDPAHPNGPALCLAARRR